MEQDHNGRDVAYFHPKDVGLYHFGVSKAFLPRLILIRSTDGQPWCISLLFHQSYHPMKAYRLTLTNELVLGYGLHNYMQVHAPRKATEEEIERFHSSDYVDYLSR